MSYYYHLPPNYYFSDVRSFRYTPTTTGVHSLILIVTDDERKSASAHVNINVLDNITLLESQQATDVNDTSMKIHFKLSKNAQAQVEYGIDANHTKFTTKEISFDYADHTQWIYGLNANTIYHYKIHYWDESGNETVSDDYTFKTLPPKGKWRTGYFYPNNSWDFIVNEIPFDMYTHMIEAFVAPMINSDGSPGLDIETYKVDTYNGSKIEDFVNTAHLHYVKALFALANKNTDKTSFEYCTSKENVDAFVAVVVKFINEHNYDGVDIDWETGFNGEGFVRFVTKLRKSLDEDKLITVAGQLRNKSFYIEVIDKIDQINMMFYDMYRSGKYKGWPQTWYNTAVRNQPGVEFDRWNRETQENGLWYMLDGGGIPAEKLGMGIPFYGRIIQGIDSNNSKEGLSRLLQPYVYNSLKRTYIQYSDLITGSGNNYWIKGVHHWDDETKSPYISYDVEGSENDAFVTYTDPRQIRESVKLFKEYNVGGMMVFVSRYEYMKNEVGEARYPLSKALVDAMDGVK